MHIHLNGQPHPIAKPLTLTELLAELGLSNKPVVIEHNRDAVLPRNFPNTTARDGDHIEIITLAAGG